MRLRVSSTSRQFFLGLLALALRATPAHAATTEPLLANGYWAGFMDFWTGQFRKQDSIVLFMLGIGALAIFIITRGKWRK